MVNAWPVASESEDSGHSRSTSERSEGRMQGPVDAEECAETYGVNRSPPGMDERRRRRNREGRGGPTRLNRWRRRLAESMLSTGPAQPGRDAKPRPWPTGEGKRRPERRGGGSALRRCKGGPKGGITKARHRWVAGWR